MKKLIILLSIFTLGNMIFGNLAFDPVLAQVKLSETRLIKLNEVNEKIGILEAQMGRSLTPAEKDELLNSMVDNALVLQAAKRDGLEITEKMIIDSFLQQNPGATKDQIIASAESQYGMPWKEISKALIDTYTVQEYIKLKGENEIKNIAKIPTEEEVLDFFNENKTKFTNPDMVRVDHIFFSTNGKNDSEIKLAKENAEKSLLEIKKGTKTFDILVQEVSEDRNSAANNGELGFITRDNPNHIQLLGKDFISKVFSLEMDQVQGVLQSNSGYHIVIVREKRSARLLKITDLLDPSQPYTVAQYIQQNMYQERAANALNEATLKIVEQLRKESSVRLMEDAIPWK